MQIYTFTDDDVDVVVVDDVSPERLKSSRHVILSLSLAAFTVIRSSKRNDHGNIDTVLEVGRSYNMTL
jgi:hypothetical protein